tara:strand:+ start:519 stop:1079 length:561 start_codon:yes stop_codon:yes gene_type:complete
MSDIQKRIGEPMSNEDLEKYISVNPSDIVKYADLSNYQTIQDLLPKDGDFKIILIEDKQNHGHWVSVSRRGKVIEYFNSYGSAPDADWRFIPRMVRIILGENTNDLTRMFKQAKKDGFKVVYNKKRLQKLSPNIQTCGRWIVFRRHLAEMGYDLGEFQKKIEQLRDDNTVKGVRPSSDWVVAKYIK